MEILISGASTGIGKASAIQLARKGHSVWAGVRNAKSFDALTNLNVKGLKPIFLDVTNENSIIECFASIRKNAGILHGLVNNAGMAVGGPIEGVQLEDWRRQFETNVFGQVRVTQEALPSLRECKGRIVNISSISGKVSSPYLGPYSASKFALEAISDSLRRELHRHGVTVSVVEPGPIATPFWEKSKTEGLEKIDQYSPMIREAYGIGLAKFKKHIDEAERTAAPVQIVVDAIDHALNSPRPKTRYPVGGRVKAAVLISRAIPDHWLDRLLASRV